jgi:cell division protease FtsH
MIVLMGGRAAEHIIFGHYSTGAADDLAKATEIARSMVMHYGMDEQLGPVNYDREPQPFLDAPLHSQREFSEDTAREIDAAIRKIIQAAFAEAVDRIKKQIDCLHQGAQLLLQKETLNEEDLFNLHVTNDSK